MGKKHPYYGKSMIIDFPDFPLTMGFVAFSRTVENLWRNLCTSHMMISVNFFLCLATRLKACNFIKNSLQRGCFPVSIPKGLGTVFFIEQLRWLLLNYVLVSERIFKKES